MTTLVEKLPITFEGGNSALMAKLTRRDQLETHGSLMLIDPTHPAQPWAAGVPADQAQLPNVLESFAAGLYGASAMDRAAKMVKPAGFTGAAGLLERTAKGGLHGITPQAGAAVAQTGPVVAFSNALVKYVLDNPAHSYYVSVWMDLTRQPSQAYNNSSVFCFNGNGQQTNSYLFNIAPNGAANTNYAIRPLAGSGLGVTEYPGATPLGKKFISLATNGWKTATAGLESSLPGDGTNTAVTGAQAGAGLSWGPTVFWNGIGKTGVTTGAGVFNPPGGASGSNKDKTDSHVIYRMYLEDLTVSGRTHAQVEALDHALYTKEVLTEGGRYYGDTYTSPATLA